MTGFFFQELKKKVKSECIIEVISNKKTYTTLALNICHTPAKVGSGYIGATIRLDV